MEDAARENGITVELEWFKGYSKNLDNKKGDHQAENERKAKTDKDADISIA